ncbi:MAG: hypothetical protein SFX73_24705 [Kofleriaceae bacterium]|nr:hypothetical protein [Kofleriaceae bacterium]
MPLTNEDEDTPSPDDALTRAETARLLGMSTAGLDQLRYHGDGPPFFRAGQRSIRYVRRDVLAYRNARTVGKKVAL